MTLFLIDITTKALVGLLALCACFAYVAHASVKRAELDERKRDKEQERRA